MLMPVLRNAQLAGEVIEVITRPEWASVFTVMYPWARFSSDASVAAVDLDCATKFIKPSQHRHDEYAALLGLHEDIYENVPPVIPEEWIRYGKFAANGIVHSFEASHPSRAWSEKNSLELIMKLSTSAHKVFITGQMSGDTPLNAGIDLRGKLKLHELIGIVYNAKEVITVDSGLLHIAVALRIPVVALFSGIDPAFRIQPQDKVTAMVSDIPCRPCNKQEICDGRFDCIMSITPAHVMQARESISNRFLQFTALPSTRKDDSIMRRK